ncbi:hypothetical protein [Lentzea guizhouensis]|nr:hypothetical protein [Lentzea guizhouensis]
MKVLAMSVFGAAALTGVSAMAAASEVSAAPVELHCSKWSATPIETQSRHWVDGKSPKNGLLN